METLSVARQFDVDQARLVSGNGTTFFDAVASLLHKTGESPEAPTEESGIQMGGLE